MKVLCFVLLLCAGCGTSSLYDWGSYEASVYEMYDSPADYDAADDIETLREEIADTRQSNTLVPPGKTAHLGMLYARVGNSAEARACFEEEKRLFPESKIFMDRLLKGLK